MTAAVIYCRISRDDEGESLGVKRQERDCRKLAKSKGWTVANVLTDNDLSAYNGKTRPAYDELLAGLRDGRFEAVIAWKLDRLTRTGVRGLAPLLDALNGRPLACVHDVIDTSTPLGEGMAAMLASMGRQESENISVRVKAKNDERAANGLPFGTRRAFGYEPDGITIRGPEAKLLRAAAADVIAGESVFGIVRRWNDAGVECPQGAKEWTGSSVAAVLTNPRAAGLRVHRGEIVGNAVWKGIIDRRTHERLVGLMKDPRRRRRTPSRRSLLTGLVFCSECGTAMLRDVTSNGKPVMRCRRAPGLSGCGHISIRALPLEELVTEAVFAALDGPALVDAVAHRDDDDGLADELVALEAQLDELSEMWLAREIDRGQHLRLRTKLERKIADVRHRLGERSRPDALADLPGPLRDAWPDLSLDRRRAVLGAVLERVVIAPTPVRGVPKFDPGRVGLVWRV